MKSMLLVPDALQMSDANSSYLCISFFKSMTVTSTNASKYLVELGGCLNGPCAQGMRWIEENKGFTCSVSVSGK